MSPDLDHTGWPLDFGDVHLVGNAYLYEYGKSTERVSGSVRPATVEHRGPAQWVLGKVVNLPMTNQPAVLVLEADGWVIVLSDLFAEHLDMPGDPRGYPITHRLRLHRLGYEPFEADAALDVIEAFNVFASLCRGAWCGVLMPTGYGTHSRVQWRRLEVPRLDPSHVGSGWAIQRNDGPKPFMQMWPGFLARWRDPAMRANLRTIVELGIESGAHTSGEAALLIGEVVLELVSWAVIVAEGSMMTTEGHDRLGPSDRLRLLLSVSGQDRALSPYRVELTRLAAQRQWLDGPHAIAELRNLVAHPNKRLKATGIPADAIEQAAGQATAYYLAAIFHLLTGQPLSDDD
jgi:hypothetical protein